MRGDQFDIFKKQTTAPDQETWQRVTGPFDSYEEAEKVVNSNYYRWRNDETVAIVRVSYHPVSVFTSKLSLEKKVL